MTVRTDLHIHSCLSPCAEQDMTPCNIAAMAHLKGLDAIAVCDHNACLNARACIAAGKRFGLLVVPGVEVTTAEELHALCYFPDISALESFCAMLESRQPFVPNRPELFGEQIVFDTGDRSAGVCQRWLGQAVDLSLEQIEGEALKRGGILVPAHINRPSQSLLAVLGFIPADLQAHTMEVKGDFVLPEGYAAVRSSDAHSLDMILEEGFILEVNEKSISGIINSIRFMK